MIKIAIIGTGMMGRFQATCLKMVRKCKILACSDIDLKKSREFAKEFNIPNYYTVADDLLEREDLDVVAILTADDSRNDLVVKCMKKGIAVFCESPLAQSYELAEKVADFAEQFKVANAVNFVHRGSPEIQKAAELVREGAVGRVLHVELSYLQSWMTVDCHNDWGKNIPFLWRLPPCQSSKGVITDFGSSIVDLASYVAGEVETLRIDARSFVQKGKKISIEAYDVNSIDSAVISAGFKNGAMGAIHITRWSTVGVNSLRLRVFGHEGGLTLDIEENSSSLKLCSGEDRYKAKWRKIKTKNVPSLWNVFINAILKNKVYDGPTFKDAAMLQRLVECSLIEKK